MSLYGGIQPPLGPPLVLSDLDRPAGCSGFQQHLAQPDGVALLKLERLAEDSRLVSSAWMQWAQAIGLELANIEDRSIAIRQLLPHDLTVLPHLS
jgi:hypothetical protein